MSKMKDKYINSRNDLVCMTCYESHDSSFYSDICINCKPIMNKSMTLFKYLFYRVEYPNIVKYLRSKDESI